MKSGLFAFGTIIAGTSAGLVSLFVTGSENHQIGPIGYIVLAIGILLGFLSIAVYLTGMGQFIAEELKKREL